MAHVQAVCERTHHENGGRLTSEETFSCISHDRAVVRHRHRRRADLISCASLQGNMLATLIVRLNSQFVLIHSGRLFMFGEA